MLLPASCKFDWQFRHKSQSSRRKLLFCLYLLSVGTINPLVSEMNKSLENYVFAVISFCRFMRNIARGLLWLPGFDVLGRWGVGVV